MDLKKLLMAAAESQADKVKDDMISHLASDEMAEKIATAINAKRADRFMTKVGFKYMGANFYKEL